MAVQQASSSSTLACFNNSTICPSHLMGSWILDSGVSDHIAGNVSLISNLTPPKTPHHSILANGSKAQVTGIGKFHLFQLSF